MNTRLFRVHPKELKIEELNILRVVGNCIWTGKSDYDVYFIDRQVVNTNDIFDSEEGANNRLLQIHIALLEEAKSEVTFRAEELLKLYGSINPDLNISLNNAIQMLLQGYDVKSTLNTIKLYYTLYQNSTNS